MRRLKSDRDWKAVFAAALLAAGGAGALQSAHPPLIRAAAERRYADLRKLTEQGADPNDCDKFGQTALEDRAVWRNKKPTVKNETTTPMFTKE